MKRLTCLSPALPSFFLTLAAFGITGGSDFVCYGMGRLDWTGFWPAVFHLYFGIMGRMRLGGWEMCRVIEFQCAGEDGDRCGESKLRLFAGKLFSSLFLGWDCQFVVIKLFVFSFYM